MYKKAYHDTIDLILYDQIKWRVDSIRDCEDVMSTTYKFVKNPDEGEKLAPQARVILGHVEAAKTAGISREALVEKLNEDVKANKLETKQDVTKLIGFYQGRLEEAGLISIERVKPEKKEKPAKEPKEKATVGKAKGKAEAVA